MSRTNEVSFPVLTEEKNRRSKKPFLHIWAKPSFFQKIGLTLSCIYEVIFAHMDEALLYKMY